MQSYTLPHDGGDRETCRAPGRSMSWWLIQKGSDWLPTICAYFSITWHVLLFWSSESCCNICHTFCDLASSHGTMNQIWLRLFPVSSRALWTCSPRELPRPRPPRSPDGLLQWCRQSWLVELGDDDMRFWESWRHKRLNLVPANLWKVSFWGGMNPTIHWYLYNVQFAIINPPPPPPRFLIFFFWRGPKKNNSQ